MTFLTPPSLPVLRHPRKPPQIICGRRSRRKKGPKPVCTRPWTPLPPLPDTSSRHTVLARPPPRSESAIALQEVLSRRYDCVVKTDRAYESGALATALSKRERAEHVLVVVTTRDAALTAACEAKLVCGKTPIIVAAGSRVPGGWKHPALNANSARKSVIVIASVRACFHQFLLNGHGRVFLKKIKFLILVDAVGVVDIGAQGLFNQVLRAMSPREKRKNVVFSRISNTEKKLELEKLINDVVRVKREQLEWCSHEFKEPKTTFTRDMQSAQLPVGSMISNALINQGENTSSSCPSPDYNLSDTDIAGSPDDAGCSGSPEEVMFRILSMPLNTEVSDFQFKSQSSPNVKRTGCELTSLSNSDSIYPCSQMSSDERDADTSANVVNSSSFHISEKLEKGHKHLFGTSRATEDNGQNILLQGNLSHKEPMLRPYDGLEADDSNIVDDTDVSSTCSVEQSQVDAFFPKRPHSQQTKLENHNERRVREIVMTGNWAGAYESLRVIMQNNEKGERGRRILVIFPTGRLAECYATMCRTDGLALQDLHRRVTPSKRERILEWIYNNDRAVLFATDAVTSSLVLPIMDIVVQFGAPHHVKDYVSRVELVRDGGESFLLLGTREADLVLKQLVDQKRSVQRQELLVVEPWRRSELNMKVRGRAYLSLVSFWLLRRSSYGWVATDVINLVNEWATQTFGEIPEVENCKVKKMPIRRKEGLRVKVQPPPPPRVRISKRVKNKNKSSKNESK